MGVRGFCAKNNAWLATDPHNPNKINTASTFHLYTGVPAAIKVFKEQKPAKMGIRVDSGDIAYLTKRARKMLDEAGLYHPVRHACDDQCASCCQTLRS